MMQNVVDLANSLLRNTIPAREEFILSDIAINAVNTLRLNKMT